MSNSTSNRNDPVPLWRARATLGGRNWRDGAYGFGGPEVAEAVGTPDEIGAELTCFLGSLGRLDVAGAYARTAHFFVRLEMTPQEGSGSTLAGKVGEEANEDPIPLWEASASVGNADGVFDAAYSYGNSKDAEAHLVGTAQEVGAELTRVLKLLTRGDVEDMKYGTKRFFLELVIALPGKQ